MTDPIHNPHDKLFKHVLGERENAASFLKSNLPSSMVAHLDLESLEVLQASFIDAQYVQSEADLLISVPVAGTPGFVYLLLEHQSSPDPLMLLRLLSYMVRVWRRYARENLEAGRLPVIVPLVLFHGPRGWEGPLDFQFLVEIPAEDFAAYTPAFRIGLFDLGGPHGQAVAGSAIVRILGDILGALGKPDFIERISRAFETLDELAAAPSFSRYFEILFRYILDVYDIPKQSLMDMAVESMKADVREAAMTTYEQIKQEGILEGRQEGILEGKTEAGAALLARLLAKRFHVDPDLCLPMLTGLDFVQYEELSEKILEAQSMEEIEEWLEAARHN
jgi:predicted transposase/invertase (TIGR01784 family)